MLNYLTVGSLALVVASLLLTQHVFTSISSYRRLQSFKGPRWAAWSQTWLFKQTMSGSLYLKLRDISLQYGRYSLIVGDMQI